MTKRMLIVDDEIDFCLIMKMYLLKKGYEVHLAHTLKEGLSKIDELRPDILVLDNNLPDGNGWDVLGDIVEKIPQIRTFLVSAHRNYSPLLSARGNIVVWEKPISMDCLDQAF